MEWNKLETIEQLRQIKIDSEKKPILIFKHSTRCSISSTALDRFERSWNKSQDLKNITPYYLDLIAFRNVSNQIATDFDIEHESPQILLINEGAVSFHESHYGINLEQILEKI